MVKLVDSRALRGANYYSYRPVVVLTVDLGEYDEVFTDAMPGFADALLELVPSLEEHRCSEEERGGLIKRMREGTLLGHVIEHLAIELQYIAGMDVGFGKTIDTDEPGVYQVIFSYWVEEAGIFAGERAVRHRQRGRSRAAATSIDLEGVYPRARGHPRRPLPRPVDGGHRRRGGAARHHRAPPGRLQPRPARRGQVPAPHRGLHHVADEHDRRGDGRQQAAHQARCWRTPASPCPRARSSAASSRPSRTPSGSATRSWSSRTTATTARASPPASPTRPTCARRSRAPRRSATRSSSRSATPATTTACSSWTGASWRRPRASRPP